MRKLVLFINLVSILTRPQTTACSTTFVLLTKPSVPLLKCFIGKRKTVSNIFVHPASTNKAWKCPPDLKF